MATVQTASPVALEAAGHSARVEFIAGRYPHVPTCSCGWSWIGYLAAHAAQTMVDAHLAGEV